MARYDTYLASELMPYAGGVPGRAWPPLLHK